MLDVIPWMRLIYSALLIGLSGVFLRELWTVWFDDRVFVGKFDVATATADADSKLFPAQIVGSQKLLVNQIKDYQSQGSPDQAADVTYLLPGMTPLNIPSTALPGVDITYQGVNFTSIFGTLRKSFLSPNEVSGSVTTRGGSYQATVEWPDAPRPASSKVAAPTAFRTPPLPSLQDAADFVACSMSWATAAHRDAKVAAWPRAQFCEWSGGLGDYFAYSAKASTAKGLDEEETARLRLRAARLRTHYADPAVFAELYRLRADLLDLLPEKARTQPELVEAQEDRLRYAMLSPTLAKLPPEQKRHAALALARPALMLDEGWTERLPGNWAALLRPPHAAIDSNAASVGLVLRDGQPAGTGFVVGPGLMITTNYVAGTRYPQPGTKTTVCFGPHAGSCTVTLEVGKTLYDGTEPGNRIAVVEVGGPDVELLTPLELAETLPAANEMTGRYAYVIGYPFADQRMPADFVELLLGGGKGGARSLMPGRILAFGTRVTSGNLETVATSAYQLTTDISTAGGTGGAPLIDLASGKVIGVHYAGLWQGERGKFEYAQPIPADVLALVARANGHPSAAAPAAANPPAPAVAPAQSAGSTSAAPVAASKKPRPPTIGQPIARRAQPVKAPKP